MAHSSWIKVKVPGSCGELIQGRIRDEDFLVSCPVNLFSFVSLKLTKERKIKCPSRNWKAKAAFEATLKLFQEHRYGGIIQISSQIPLSKGMASSTADIVGTCLATATALGNPISPQEIAEIAIKIEPTDGIIYPGIVVFNHRQGILKEKLTFSPPRLKILAVDLGGEIDTLHFNQRDHGKVRQKHQSKLSQALNLLRDGLAKNEPLLIGHATSISAKCNQEILPKPELEKLLELTVESGGVGVNVAHSGSIIGMLFPEEFTDLEHLKVKIKKEFRREFNFYSLELTQGKKEINGAVWSE
jgi:L-threonine kinase